MTKDELMDYQYLLNDLVELIEEIRDEDRKTCWNYDVLIHDIKKLQFEMRT